MNNYIIGGGITGLAAGHLLHCPIIERNNKIGGLCRTVSKEGFSFDYTGHYLHIPNSISNRVEEIIDLNAMDKVEKHSGIAINDRLIEYPFQSNFHNAGEKIKEECIEGFLSRPCEQDIHSFRDWILKYYGNGIGEHFMFPYNEKLWQYDINELTTEWIGDFIPDFTEQDIIQGNTGKRSYNDYFYYPSKGGFDNILPLLKNNNIFNRSSLVTPDLIRGPLSGNGIMFNSKVINIDINRRVMCTDNNEFKYDNLISTMPLKELMRMINGEEDQLEYTSVYNINLGIRGKCPVNYHWIYFPQKHIPFYRAGIPSNVNSNMAPQGHYSLSIEIAYRNDVQIDWTGIIESLISYGLIKSENDIVLRYDIDIKYAYVIYNKQRTNTVQQYLAMLKENDIYSIGRYGKWHYSFVANDITDALKTAGEII